MKRIFFILTLLLLFIISTIIQAQYRLTRVKFLTAASDTLQPASNGLQYILNSVLYTGDENEYYIPTNVTWATLGTNKVTITVDTLEVDNLVVTTIIISNIIAESAIFTDADLDSVTIRPYAKKMFAVGVDGVDWFVADSLQRIGIMTSIPKAPLHVSSGGGVTSVNMGPGVFIGDDEANNPRIELRKTAAVLYMDFATNEANDYSFRFNINGDNNVNFATWGSGNVMTLYDGKVGIATITPDTDMEVVDESADSEVMISTYDDDATEFSSLLLRKADNTEVSPAIVSDSDVLGDVSFWGYDGDQFIEGVKIRAVVNGVVGNNDMPTDLEFYTNNTEATPSILMTLTNDGNVGIGTSIPTGLLHLSQNAYTELSVDSHSDSPTNFPYVILVKSRGTVSSPTRTLNDDVLGQFLAQGYDTGYGTGGFISFEADGDWGDDSSDEPTRITFHTAPDGSATEVERMRIDRDGNVGIGTTAPVELFHYDKNNGTDGTGAWYTNASVSTTNAAATTIYTLATTTDRVYRILIDVACAQDDGSNSMGALHSFTIKNVAGTVTEQGDVSIQETDDSAGVSISGAVSGTNYLIQVTGINPENWNWEANVRVTVVTH